MVQSTDNPPPPLIISIWDVWLMSTSIWSDSGRWNDTAEWLDK